MPHRRIELKYIISWCLVCAFFFFEFLVRISPNTMTVQLVQDFSVNAKSLSTLVSIYYFTFIAMQFPSGFILDRYDPSRVLAAALGVMAIGIALFATSQTYHMAMLARVVMGIGASFSLLGCLKFTTLYFPPERHGLFIGIIGMLAAVAGYEGQTAIANLVTHYSWRGVYGMLFGIGLILLVLIAFFTPHKQPEKPADHPPLWSTVKHNFANKKFISLIFFTGFMNTPIVAFAGLWAVPYIAIAHNINIDQASHMVAWIWIGQIPGYIAINWLADHMPPRGLMVFCAIAALICMVYILQGSAAHPDLFNVALFGLGFFCCANFVSFALISKITPITEMGIAGGIASMMNLLVGTIGQLVIGWLAAYVATASHISDLHNLAESQLFWILLLVPISLALAAVVALGLRDFKVEHA